MNKRILYFVLVSGLTLNLYFGTRIYLRSAQPDDRNNPRHNIELFVRVLEEVRSQYVDGEKMTYQDLVYGALKGMVGTLDPHSEFMAPQKFQYLQSDTEGSFGGIGIVIGMRNEYLTVLEPMEGTPAYRAGILPGDQIVKINGESTQPMTNLDEAVQLLRGAPGTDVVLTIKRPAVREPFDVVLTRADIKVHKVKDMQGKREFPIGPDGIGYVRLSQFDEQTSDDLDQALDRMQAQGMKSLILDLRGNPGGLLDQAVRVCDKFLPPNKLIVSTEGRGLNESESYYSTRREKNPDLKIAILVDGASASASEIVAGCLQDMKRAIIVGEQTFGKGSVQKIIPLSDGSALRLTTSRYYTPSHKVIHGTGITPDIQVTMTEEEQQALFLQRMPGGLENLSVILDEMDAPTRERFRFLAKHVRDRQLDRATDLLKGIQLLSHRQKEPSAAGMNE